MGRLLELILKKEFGVKVLTFVCTLMWAIENWLYFADWKNNSKSSFSKRVFMFSHVLVLENK